ncbi:hypothetical protein QTP88_019293 [Uroleucon formosanum]
MQGGDTKGRGAAQLNYEMIRFLQINVGVSRSAQDLMIHTARESNADVVLINEQYRNASEDVGWYSDEAGRAAVYVTGGITVDATGPPDAGFRWVQINSIRIYSVYYSPNVTLDEYNMFLYRLESSVRGSDGPVLIAGDFNAKRPEWGSPTTDQCGNALAELAATLDLHTTFPEDKKTPWPDACRELEQASREAMKALRMAIKKRLSIPGRLQEIIHGLFPTRQFVDWQIPDDSVATEEVTASELVNLAHALPLGKAPGPDGVPDMVVKAVILRKTADVTNVLNNCLRSGCFPRRWKEARLVLIRKPGKPTEVPSSYRPLCMVNTIGKLFERIVKRRLETHLTRNPEEISDNQFGFRKGRSTIDAIEKVLDIVNRNEAKPWKRRELCALVSIDVANAFNTVPWDKIGDALIRKNTPTYLVRLLRDYFRERLLQTDAGDKKVSCGVPQGSVIGPTLWNIFYNDLLQQRLPEGIEIIAFADDIAVIGIAKDTDSLEVAMNSALSLVSEWIVTNGLRISPSKTVAMTLTSKRRNRRPQFVLLEETLQLKEHIKYLGVELNFKLGFKEHIKMVRAKALKTSAALTRLMPNIGGPSPTIRKLLTSVVNSYLLYAAPVWQSTTKF